MSDCFIWKKNVGFDGKSVILRKPGIQTINEKYSTFGNHSIAVNNCSAYPANRYNQYTTIKAIISSFFKKPVP